MKFFRHIIFKQILVIDGWVISCEIALIWMSLDFTDDQSTLVQVMACCRQAPSHYLSRCWLRSLSPYGVTRPQWVKHLQDFNINLGQFSIHDLKQSPSQWAKTLHIFIYHVFSDWTRYCMDISMALCKTAVSPLLMHWRYCSLTLNPRYDVCHISIVIPFCRYHHLSSTRAISANHGLSLCHMARILGYPWHR